MPFSFRDSDDRWRAWLAVLAFAPAALAPAVASPAPAAIEPLTAPLDANQVVEFLDQSIDWYRSQHVAAPASNEPSDLLVTEENRRTAGQILSDAFAFAKADAALLAAAPRATASSAGRAGGTLSPAAQLIAAQQRLDAQAQGLRERLELAPHRGAAARRERDNSHDAALIAAERGELQLVEARKTLVDALLTTVNVGTTTALSPEGLQAQINAMSLALPVAAGVSLGGGSAATAANAKALPALAGGSAPLAAGATAADTAARFGVWQWGAKAVDLIAKQNAIQAADRSTAALLARLESVRQPLLGELRALAQQGDALAPVADPPSAADLAAGTSALETATQRLHALADRFDQLSTVVVPLSKEAVELDQYRRNLANWRGETKTAFRGALTALGIRLAVLACVFLLLFAGAEFWKRLVLRYVPDVRHRRQLLLVRKVILWSLVGLVVALACASEWGSIVTFAGLITAGIAVAMQSVLVSVVGYFFLIGKYGIRVGDRVQIGEVTGEVIDLGLVRMYLMELAGHGSLGPTGRVVAFANSVVFQVSGGLFKQIAGVNVAWRELNVALPAGFDYAKIKQSLLDATVHALADYREEIDRETREIAATTMAAPETSAVPRVQLQFTPEKVQATIHYPVQLQHAAEIDERVSHAVYQVINDVARARAA